MRRHPFFISVTLNANADFVQKGPAAVSSARTGRVFAETCRATTSDNPLSLIYKWKAIRDIHSLYTQDFMAIYLPGHEAVEGTYLVAYCRLKLER